MVKRIAAQGISLRVKMTAWTLAVSILLQGVGSIFVLFQQRASIDSFFDQRLRTRCSVIADEVAKFSTPITGEKLKSALSIIPNFPLAETFVTMVADASGRVAASSIEPAPALDGIPIEEARQKHSAATARVQDVVRWEADDSDPGARANVWPITLADGQDAFVITLADDRYAESLFDSALRMMGMTFLIGVFATGLSAWLIAGIVTAPLRSLRRMASTLEPEKLHQPPAAQATQAFEVTEFRQQIDDIRSRLRDAFSAQERFLLNVSHELKTPIAVVLTEIETLSPNRPPEEVDHLVRSVREEMRRLGTLVNSFLTLAAVQSGKPVQRPQINSANDFVVEAAGTCQMEAETAKVAIDLNLSETDPTPLILGDPNLLRVMVENILRNAIRFAPLRSSVKIDVVSDDATCSISIRDYGPGIPEDVMGRIFDRFSQASSEVSRGRGHGLGLSISKGIVELHHGTIGVENLPDAGCRFTITLPVVQSHRSGSLAATENRVSAVPAR